MALLGVAEVDCVSTDTCEDSYPELLEVYITSL